MKKILMLMLCTQTLCLFSAATNNNNDANQTQFSGQHNTQSFSFRTSHAEKMIAESMVPWPTEGKLLDAGCRDGTITAMMANENRNVHVDGMDSHVFMLEEAKKLNTSVKNWIEKKTEEMTFKDTYNIITSFSVLHWGANIEKAFAAIFLALKPGGKGYFTISADDERKPSIVCQTLKKEPWKGLLLIKDPIFANSMRSYTPADMKKLCNNAGFDVKKCDSKEIAYTFASTNEFENWCSSISNYKETFGTQHDQFVKEIVKEYGNYAQKTYGNPLEYRSYQLHVVVEKPKK